MIGHERHEVYEASDGAEALRRAASLRPDVIFLDLQMQPMDGFAVLDALRAAPATRDARVVIATSSIIGPAERQRLAAADAILSKLALSRAAIATLLASPSQQPA
jgi:CheY-like chemotaxis protein